MANRNEDYYSPGSRRQSQDWRENDDTQDQGRGQFGRSRDSNEQSGSTGRFAGYGDFGRGEYGGGRSGWSGQERYGQSGYGQGGYGRSGSEEGDYGQGRSGQVSSGGYGYGYGGGGMQRGRQGQGHYRGGWNEPYGEGQQYTSGGEFGGRSGYGAEGGGTRDYGSQGYAGGPQGYGARGMGEHRGKGPKGYQRSDERIKELLCERLRDDPEIDPSEVTITVQGGKITLEGTVDSRLTKNAIEEVAEQFGTQDVESNLRIQRQGQQSEAGRQARSATGGEETAEKKQKHN